MRIRIRMKGWHEDEKGQIFLLQGGHGTHYAPRLCERREELGGVEDKRPN